MALIVSLKMAADQHRSSLCDDIACNGNNWENVQWDGSANNFAFVSTSRDHKQEWLRVADAEAVNVREVISETAPEFFESGNGKVNWKYLPKSKEFLWFWALSDADKRAYLKSLAEAR